MKERPILFSAPMVRAILEGRKTQTRRTIKDTGLYAIEERFHGKETADREKRNLSTQCKHGQPGDWLWVKETHQAHPIYGSPCYRADYMLPNGRYGPNPVDAECWPWKPSIFMPRRLSRITLGITDVRVERLQDITEADAKAEGSTPLPDYVLDPAPHRSTRHIEGYCQLWESINGIGSWAENPWVWAITFKRITP